jgi:hypothetical protein
MSNDSFYSNLHTIQIIILKHQEYEIYLGEAGM